MSKLLSCFFVWEVPPSYSLRRADVIVAQSFGLPANGLSNVSLAQVCDDLQSRHYIPVVSQWEIADQMKTQVVHRIEKHRVPGKYLDTYEVISQAWEFCKSQDRTNAVIVAHPDHMWRCVMVAKTLGFYTFVPEVNHIPYDPKSEQPWTRSAARFIPREIMARLLYLKKGWI